MKKIFKAIIFSVSTLISIASLAVGVSDTSEDETQSLMLCGRQGGGAVCYGGLCCSQFGYCGSTPGYCCLSAGCQVGYGGSCLPC